MLKISSYGSLAEFLLWHIFLNSATHTKKAKLDFKFVNKQWPVPNDLKKKSNVISLTSDVKYILII